MGWLRAAGIAESDWPYVDFYYDQREQLATIYQE